MISRLWHGLTKTLRRQLVLAVALVHAAMMTLFVVDLVARQHDQVLRRQRESARVLSKALGASASGWLASNDVVGLQEIIHSQSRFPDLRYAMLTDPRGRVLAHTDRTRLGQFVVDLPESIREAELERSATLVDVVVPVLLDKRLVGWARVGIGQDSAQRSLAAVTRAGVLYGVVAIAIGSLLAFFTAARVTRRIRQLQYAMARIGSGNQTLRAALGGQDEVAQLANDFNHMLDRLERHAKERASAEQALKTSQALTNELETIINAFPGILIHKDRENRFVRVNRFFADLHGVPQDSIVGKTAFQLDPSTQTQETWDEERQLIDQGRSQLNKVEPWDTPQGRKWLITTKVPFLLNDKPAGIICVSVDITRQKEFERFLVTVTDTFPGMVGYWTREQTNRFANANYLDWFGRTRREMEGIRLRELLGQAVYHEIEPHVVAALRGNTQRYEQPLARKDKSLGWFRVHYIPDVMNGVAQGFFVVAYDITDLKEAQNRAEHLNRELEQAQEIAKMGSWTLDIPTGTLTWSSETYALFGLNAETPVTLEALVALLHEEDRARVLSAWEEAIRGSEYSVEYRIMAKGETRWVYERAQIEFDREGRPLRGIGMIQDITARKHMENSLRASEELFRSIFERNRSVMLLLNPDTGEILGANPAASAYYGFPLERLVGMSIDEINILTPDEIAERRRDALLGRTTTFLFRHRLASGELRDVEAYVTAIVREQQPMLFSIIHDVTERIRLERDLIQSNRDLEDFAYAASHDLRAPLRAIESLAEWLKDDLGEDLPANSARNLGLLRGRVRRMEALLDGILEYSRAGKAHAQVESVDVAALVEDVVDLIHVDQAIELQLGPLPSLLTAQVPLRQVLQNLISNAIKHHDTGNPRIRIWAEDLGAFYEFSVSDDGPGIPEPFREKVFGMFQTLKSRDQVEGSGIGLAVVRKVVSRYGGRIWIEPSGPKGTTFRFTWPKNLPPPEA